MFLFFKHFPYLYDSQVNKSMKKNAQFPALLSFFLLLALNIFAQAEENITLQTDSGELFGTLLAPKNVQNPPVVLMIVGSGPTDRDGNSIAGKNNSLKFLAEALAEKGIATLRYDKRGIAASHAALDSVHNLRFDRWVNDAKGWVGLLKKRNQFSTITVAGHSQGALVGMLAAQGGDVDKYISIAGAGEPINKILEKQLMANSPIVAVAAQPILDKLAQGELVDTFPPMLAMLFNKPTQPFLISWMKFDPAEEIVKLNIPCLIVQGTNDLQVKLEDAKKLHLVYPQSTLLVIDKMNHVLKEVTDDSANNYAAYRDPELPVMKELVNGISRFVRALE